MTERHSHATHFNFAPTNLICHHMTIVNKFNSHSQRDSIGILTTKKQMEDFSRIFMTRDENQIAAIQEKFIENLNKNEFWALERILFHWIEFHAQNSAWFGLHMVLN